MEIEFDEPPPPEESESESLLVLGFAGCFFVWFGESSLDDPEEEAEDRLEDLEEPLIESEEALSEFDDLLTESDDLLNDSEIEQFIKNKVAMAGKVNNFLFMYPLNLGSEYYNNFESQLFF